MTKRGFTLLELIVVIVILGILATLGFTQYGRMTEKMRTAELVSTISSMRKSAINYYLEKGSLSGMTSSDVGIGTSAGEIPGQCTSTHYYYYRVDPQTSSIVNLVGRRCTSGGKPPQGSSGWDLYMDFNASTLTGTWHCGGSGECQDIVP